MRGLWYGFSMCLGRSIYLMRSLLRRFTEPLYCIYGTGLLDSRVLGPGLASYPLHNVRCSYQVLARPNVNVIHRKGSFLRKLDTLWRFCLIRLLRKSRIARDWVLWTHMGEVHLKRAVWDRAAWQGVANGTHSGHRFAHVDSRRMEAGATKPAPARFENFALPILPK